jgi:hypothetical protein
MQIDNTEDELSTRSKWGCPRKYDYELLAKEMIEWAKDEDSINLCEFCAERAYPHSLIRRLKKEIPAFSDAIEITKMQLAARRERFLNDGRLHARAWDRCARLYDLFLDDHETKLEDKDAERKRGIADRTELNLVALAKMAAEGSISQKD